MNHGSGHHKNSGQVQPELQSHSATGTVSRGAPTVAAIRESWKGILEVLRIRVALQWLEVDDVGVGNVEKFSRYFEELRVIPCSSLLTGEANTAAGIFSKQVGAAQGELFLDFTLESEMSYDLTDFDQFQLFRSVHAILYIGVVTCDSSATEIERARMKLTTKNEGRFPVQRCFLFGDSLPSGLTTTDSMQYSLVVTKDENGQEDENKIQGQLAVLVRELASSILRSFDAKYAELSHLNVQIRSPRDVDKVFAASPPARLAARSAGRLAKLAGDLYLLSGAYTDAVNALVTAIEETKLHGDLLWYAGAQEALQIALVCQNEISLNGLAITGSSSASGGQERKEATSLLWIALPEKLKEVASLYLKADMAILSFEVHRTISALLDYGGSPSEAAMALCHGWSGHRQLNFSDKLYVLTVFIDRFEKLGMTRKRAFYLQSLASLLATHRENVMALQVLMKTFSIYGINLGCPVQGTIDGGWGRLRMSILRKAASLAEAHPSAVLPVQYYCALLAHADDLEGEEQQKIYRFLRDTARDGASLGSINGLLPIFKSLHFDTNHPGLWRREYVRLRNSTSDSTFIYNPFSAARGSEGKMADQVAIAVDEPFSLCLILSNPYNFRLDLQQVTLPSNSLPVLSSEVDVSLKAHLKGREIQLNVTPQRNGEGQLCINQLQATIFGVRFTFDLPPLTVTVIPPQPVLRVTMDRAVSHLSLLVGERRKITARVENVAGGITAKIDGISIVSRWGEGQTPTMNSILFPPVADPVTIVTKIPPQLAAGESTEVELLITGRLHWEGCEVLVTYGRSQGDYNTDNTDNASKGDQDPIYRRKASIKIAGTIRKAFSITSISALPLQSTVGADPFHCSGTNENDWCLAVIDFDNPLPETFTCVVECHGNVERSFELGRLDTKRLILPMHRLAPPPPGPVQLMGSQLAALRKDCQMADEQVEAINPRWYWIKKKLIESMKVRWSSGTYDMSDIIVSQETASLNHFLLPPLSIQVSLRDAKPTYSLNTPVIIDVTLTAGEDVAGPYFLRILPALYISDDEYSLDYKEILAIDGGLLALGEHLPYRHHMAIWAVSPCRIKLLVHVEMLRDHQVFSQPHPLVLDFSKASDHDLTNPSM